MTEPLSETLRRCGFQPDRADEIASAVRWFPVLLRFVQHVADVEHKGDVPSLAAIWSVNAQILIDRILEAR